MTSAADQHKQGLLRDGAAEDEDPYINCVRRRIWTMIRPWDVMYLNTSVTQSVKINWKQFDFMSSERQGKHLNWSCSFCHHG